MLVNISKIIVGFDNDLLLTWCQASMRTDAALSPKKWYQLMR